MKFSGGKYLCLAALGALAIWAVVPATGSQDSPRVEVKQSIAHARTAALRDIAPYSQGRENAPVKIFPLRQPKNHGGGGGGGGGRASWTDPVLQSSASTPLAATAGAQFAGLTSVGYVPPDPNLAVSATQVVAIDNVDFAVYDKNGNVLRGQGPIHAIFGALGSNDLCATTDGGDPIVLFDKIDQRWLITQLSYNSAVNDDHECIAISDTADATGSYDVYDIPFGSNLPDYPKFGIWSDKGAQAGVYFSANIFASGNSFAGAEFCAFPLSSMATPPGTLNWVCLGPDASAYNVLPADQEGGTNGEVAGGTPELYLQFADNLGSSSGNELWLYKYNVDFGTPGNTTLSGPAAVPVATFHEACGGGACVPQLNTKEKLDSLGDRVMYRASFRHYSNATESLVVNHSVQLSSSSNQTGMRWYQIDNPNSAATVAQASTYAPDTSYYRWMGSIAQDKAGDLGAGYSRSSPSSYVSIGFTGQGVGDPTNTLEKEAVIATSKGAQTKVNRWGDYSAVSLDPSDDCTFWYTNEVLTSTGSYTNWQTYIASFKFSSCAP